MEDIVEQLKSNSNDIERQSPRYGIDQVKEHCLELRIDVDLATEIAHRDINQHRDALLKGIEDYEARTIGLKDTDFKNPRICFEKNLKSIEMSSIGVLRFKGVFNLKDFRQVDISDLVGDAYYGFKICAQDTGIFDILCCGSSFQLQQKTIDKDKKIISQRSHNMCTRFIEHKDNVLTYDGYSRLLRLNLASVILYRIYPDCLSLNDTNVYFFSKDQLNIYSRELEHIDTIGQHHTPTAPFYIPGYMLQFECRNGKYYWLNGTHLQILREDNGTLIKSIGMKANHFLFTSTGNIVLLNTLSKELNYFSQDGDLVEIASIDNWIDGLALKSLTKNDEPVFYDATDKKIYFI